jgi:hypothetical protein
MADITTEQVWAAVEENPFAVLGMVNAKQQPRTVGIVYIVRERILYIGSGANAWKVKHVAANPAVSMTVAIPKRVPLMPWIKVPAATITFSGTAEVLTPDETPPDVIDALFRGMVNADELKANHAVIAVRPAGHFVTYGIGVSLMQMRDTELAGGRVPVA